MKKMILMLALALMLVPAAVADNLDFGFAFTNWSWAGGATPLTAASTLVFTTGQTGASQGFALLGPGVMTTGNYTGGSFIFAPGPVPSIAVAGCGGICFLGQLTSFTAVALTGNQISFSGTLVSGGVNPAIFGALGIPAPVNAAGLWTGTLSGTLDIAPGTHFGVDGGGFGTNGSMDLVLNPVAEPGSLALLGSGLIGMAGWLRKKILA